MKDIIDYFTSPPKKSDLKTNEKGTEIPLIETDKNSDEFKREKNILSNIENSTKKKKCHEQKRKTKKSKPIDDPVVNNMSDLLSNSLIIISPDNSGNKEAICLEQNKSYICVEGDTKRQSKTTPHIEKKRLNKTIHDVKRRNKSQDNNIEDESKSSLKKIESNNKSISVGSSIISCEKSDDVNKKSTNILNAFQFMMESRNQSIGQNSLGRDKLENEDKGNDKDYKKKLSARKDLLKNWSEKKGASKRMREEEEIEEIIANKLNRRAKRLKKLLRFDKFQHGSDDSNEVFIKKKKNKVKRMLSSSSENSRDSDVQVSENQKEIFHGDIEEIAQDKVLGTSKTKDTQNLVTFYGIFNKEKKSEVTSSKNNNKNGTSASKSTQKRKKKTSEISSNNELKSKETTTEESSLENPKETLKKSIDYLSAEDSVSQIEKISPENQDSRSRSSRSWKMKIKINPDAVENDANSKTNDNDIKKISRNKKNQSYIELSDESYNEGIAHEKNIDGGKEIILSDSESDFEEKKEEKKQSGKDVKLAPVFVKATAKRKLDPEVIEARKQFLMSGIPSILKKAMEKQQSYEEREFDVFPSISHVQQKCENQTMWNLPNVTLNLNEILPFKLDNYVLECKNLTNSHIIKTLNIQTEMTKVDKLKTLVNKIKADNPNYPVYKSFRLIYHKSGKENKNITAVSPAHRKKRGRYNKSTEVSQETPKQDTNLIEYTTWTEKYKPQCADDIIGNTEGVKALKKWLQTWMNFSQEINARKKNRRDSTSGSEFDFTDWDSKDSIKLPGSTVIVGGPCGSGKSSAIYAICDELGFNVIELNASSKRTGKRLLQELQEATQSHQVRKETSVLQHFCQSDKAKDKKVKKNDQSAQKKMCVLLIDDVDIVFEQDDGFISALSQLATTSKRPIIMTTTDSNSVFSQRFISQYEYIAFLPLSSLYLSVWLQIVCLVEGLFVDKDEIGNLLESNKGDMRKTMLELQFWVLSGGEIIKNEIPVKIKMKQTTIEEKILDDDTLLPSIKDINRAKENLHVHGNCLTAFKIFRNLKSYYVPYYLDLGLLWWNIPNILSIPNFSQERINRLKGDRSSSEEIKCKVATKRRSKTSLSEKLKMNSLGKLLDSIAFTDVSFRKVNYFDGIEPDVKDFSSDIRDSLELDDCMDCYDGNLDFVHEITHSLVNGYIEEYNGIEEVTSTLNMGVPDRTERRWRAKHHVCEDVFQEALSLSSYLERKSVALDYMPMMRNISRSENYRAANNTKRGNRFRNYLKDLNVNCNDNTIKVACNILRLNDEY